MRTIKESLVALHIQRRHKTDKDERYRKKTKCTIHSLPDLGWSLLGQGVFGMAELRHPSCANLGTCILRSADF